MQEVYRYGTTDDCMSHWSALYRCLKRKTKFADQVTYLRQQCMPGPNSRSPYRRWPLVMSSDRPQDADLSRGHAVAGATIVAVVLRL